METTPSPTTRPNRRRWPSLRKASPIILGFRRLPVFLSLFVGYAYTAIILNDLKQDTTSITNAGFAILATLATLSFGCARAVEDAAGDRFAYAGERCFHAALMVIMASLLKYVAIAVCALGPSTIPRLVS